MDRWVWEQTRALSGGEDGSQAVPQGAERPPGGRAGTSLGVFAYKWIPKEKHVYGGFDWAVPVKV